MSHPDSDLLGDHLGSPRQQAEDIREALKDDCFNVYAVSDGYRGNGTFRVIDVRYRAMHTSVEVKSMRGDWVPPEKVWQN